MNQPTLKTAFKLILAVIITFGLSLAIQSALAIYNGPACPPPGCNVPAPINVGSSTNPITQTMFDTLNVGQQQIYHVGGIGVAGILTVNTDTLLTNLQNRVMIGTTAPIGSSKLTIEMGAPNGEGLHIHRLANAPYSYLKITDEGNLPIFTVHESGNVGIGTGNPQAKLSVGGDGDANSMASINGGAGKMYGLYVNGGTSVSIYGDNTFGSGVTGWSTNAAGVYGNTQSGYGVYGNNAGASGYGVFGNGPTGGFFQSSAAGPALVTGTGNVGIGTANPGYKLDVQGSLSADTIRLKTNASQGRVLMSDNLGNASWVATSTLGLGGGSGQWTTTGSNIYSSNTGNVGVGMDPGATGKFVVLNNDPAGPTYGVYAFSSMTRPSVGVFGSGLTWAGYFVGNGFFSGNVGIGITNPGAKLEVSGGNFKITNGFMAYVKEGIGCPPGDTVVAYRTSPKFCDAGGGCPDCTTTSHDWSTTNSSVETCIYRSETAPDDCIYGSDLTCYATSYTLCNP